MATRRHISKLCIVFTIGICSLLYASAQLQGKEGESMAEEKQKRALLIIAHQGFRDEEFLEPKAILEKNGFKVDVASSSTDKAQGMLGATCKPDLLLSQVKVDDYSAVVFIGGAGSSEYWEDKKAHEIARQTVASGKILGAICIAPVTLANAGVLQGKKATVFQSEAKALKARGARYTGNVVEKDGLIITASGPAAAKEFGRALIEALSDQSAH